MTAMYCTFDIVYRCKDYDGFLHQPRGTGSRSQCFSGTFLSNAMMSSVVTAWKADKLDVAWSLTSACNWCARCSGTNPIHLGCDVVGEFIRRQRFGDDGCGGFNSAFTCDHNARVCSLWWSRSKNSLLAPGRDRLIRFRPSVDSLKETHLHLF